jgi:hypothetical protein
MSRISKRAAGHKWVSRDTVAALFLLLAAPALAAPAPPAPKDKILHDAWYTVTVKPDVRYAYYNDRVELRGGRLFFQNKFWKQEEGYLNEEQIGAYAADDAELTPLFFNFHSTFRTTETTIDGNVKDGKSLTVKIRKGNTDLPIVKRSIPNKAILSLFFPLWLGKRLSQLKVGSPVTFTTILEDNIDVGFSPVNGTARLEKPDEFATKTKTSRLTVDYRDQRSFWYVEQSGMPVRIDMRDQKAVTDRVTPEAAKRFLEE